MRTPFTNKAQLDISWSEYFELILEHDREVAGDDELRILDAPLDDSDDADDSDDSDDRPERRSWIFEASRCRRAFEEYRTLADMPVETREMVAGLGQNTTDFFGGMNPSHQFRTLFEEDLNSLDAPLKAMIPLDRDRKISTHQLDDYVFSVHTLHGAGISAASRLAGMKRPDSILPINEAIRASINACFGEKGRNVRSYVHLHEQIWEMPWFQAEAPSDETERLVWNHRVALLDALFFDLDGDEE